MIQNKNKISLGICLGPFIIGRPAYPGEGGLEKTQKIRTRIDIFNEFYC